MSEENGRCVNMVNSIWTPFLVFLGERVGQNEAWQQQNKTQIVHCILFFFFFFLQIHPTPPRNNLIQLKKNVICPQVAIKAP